MPSGATYALIKEIKSVGIADKVALMMECATDAWQLSNNAFPYGLDLLARNPMALVRARRLFDTRPRPQRHEAGLCLEGAFRGSTLRIWLKAAGMRWAKVKPGKCEQGVLCVDPYLNLDLMAASPDTQYILEQRAALAECLFIDEMPEDQLHEFMDYVRVC